MISDRKTTADSRKPHNQANPNRSPRLLQEPRISAKCGRKAPKRLEVAGAVFAEIRGRSWGIGTAGGGERDRKRTAEAVLQAWATSREQRWASGSVLVRSIALPRSLSG